MPVDHIDIFIGQRIRELRAAHGISLAALGTAIHVSAQQIQRIEAGKNRIYASILQRIADHFAVSLSTFSPKEPNEAFVHYRDVDSR